MKDHEVFARDAGVLLPYESFNLSDRAGWSPPSVRTWSTTRSGSY